MSVAFEIYCRTAGFHLLLTAIEFTVAQEIIGGVTIIPDGHIRSITMCTIIPTSFIHIVLTYKLNGSTVILTQFKFVAELVNVFPRDRAFTSALLTT